MLSIFYIIYCAFLQRVCHHRMVGVAATGGGDDGLAGAGPEVDQTAVVDRETAT